jgi:hypothetical protein
MTVEEHSTDHPEIRQNSRSEVPPNELHPKEMPANVEALKRRVEAQQPQHPA